MPPVLSAHPERVLSGSDISISRTTFAQRATQFFIGRQSRARWQKIIFSWPFPIALFILWQLGTEHGWIAPQTLPPPQMVWDTFVSMLYSGELAQHITVSVMRVVVGFSIGGLLALLLGVAMGLSQTIKEYLYPTFKLISYIPTMGWLPLLIMVFGIGESLKFVLIAKATFIPVVLNTYQGIRNVPVKYVDMGRVYGFSPWQLLRRIIFPAAFPSIWNGIRYGLTHSWLVLVVVELLASSEGLGFMMANGQQLFQIDVVLVAVGIIGVIGFLMDKVFAMVEEYVLRWRRSAF